MNNFRVFMEKDDNWIELGIFSAKTGEEALENALKSSAVLQFYSIDELKFVNLEYQRLT
ncbi:hypothetical protein [Peribacillus frigoritolerans]|uniref:hypothetical protein n=1 Tax=Peribacillus frigoritolerans TaxID=450367 RepID=UPI002E1EEEB3|nr:hypothetical protein [Peribacillus frigoritolerans]